MKKIQAFLFVAGAGLICSSIQAGKPLWTFTLPPGSNPVQNVPENITATVTYNVHNQSTKEKILSLKTTPGLVQTSECKLAPKGRAHDSCTLTLKIIGELLPPTGIHGGPVLCQDSNPLQCYQPSNTHVLSITKTKNLEDWKNWGQNTHNNHHNPNAGITKDNVSKLVELCKIDYTQGLQGNPSAHSTSSKPVIVKDTIYWTGFAGKFGAHKIMRNQLGDFVGCKELWVQDVSQLLNVPAAPGAIPSVRSSPAYYERANGQGTLLYTAFSSIFSLPFPLWFSTPPLAFALDANTGTMLWQIDLVDTSAVAVGGDAVAPSTTSSPSIYKNTAYIGIASANNALDTIPLTFRGHMIALNLGGPDMPSIKWTQYTIPPRPASYTPGTWFAGGGVWASTPSIIPELDLVIFGSGQLYNYPDFTAECMDRDEIVTTPSFTTTKKGQTGIGAQQCLAETEIKLKALGISEPLATNSIIALNITDGSYAWHVPTAGIDSWQSGCGVNVVGPSCGPDWDVGGSSPIVAKLKSLGKVVISHNKGGEVFWINAKTGKLLRRVDVCVGSTLGGIHWGLSYDPHSETIYASCSAGGIAPNFGGQVNFLSILANGRKTCMTGYLNAIDANSGKLKWQTVPASSEIVNVNSPGCPDELYSVDERFKYGLNFDSVIKNNQFNVPVNIMPNNPFIPLANQEKARSNGVPANANDIVYWPVYYGTVYALDSKTGAFLKQMNCDQGAMYAAGPSVAKGLVMFGCGYGFTNPDDMGKSVMIYGLPNIITTETSKEG
ncbi:PQQ-binding-like beta-propeller repeat protein [Legionella longbeachae]|uniref:hypothetical protein n=1 Tax=Legionella longbeachae TaxID=450 RepID=UPI00124787BA|nr:hypothetical protein [Legionella longbeachae]QEY51382.1 hypothetical protein FQU71_09070 [Legionella longbeachae]